MKGGGGGRRPSRERHAKRVRIFPKLEIVVSTGNLKNPFQFSCEPNFKQALTPQSTHSIATLHVHLNKDKWMSLTTHSKVVSNDLL